MAVAGAAGAVVKLVEGSAIQTAEAEVAAVALAVALVTAAKGGWEAVLRLP